LSPRMEEPGVCRPAVFLVLVLGLRDGKKVGEGWGGEKREEEGREEMEGMRAMCDRKRGRERERERGEDGGDDQEEEETKRSSKKKSSKNNRKNNLLWCQVNKDIDVGTIDC
jgi:hypothetical protein